MKKCVFHELFGCDCGNEYCIVNRCLEGEAFPGIINPESKFCLYRIKYGLCGCEDFSKRGIRWYFPDVDAVLEESNVDQDYHIFKGLLRQRYIPVIDLNDGDTWVWDRLDVKYICVSLYQLIRDKELFNEVLKSGLHNFLAYDGIIILSSIMPDEYLDVLDVDAYVRLVKKLDADILTSLDNYTYYDDPYYISWQQLIKGLKSISALSEINKPILPLLKGGSLRQIAFSLKYFRKIGAKYIMFPISGLSRDNKMLLMKYIRLIDSYHYFNYILYDGVSHFIYLLKNAYAYIGSEWYRKSLQYRIFEDGFFIYLDSGLESISKMEKLNIHSMRDLMVYNLKMLLKFFSK